MTGTRATTVDAGEVALHVETVDVDGPAVVVAHGVGSSSRFVLDAFAGPLAHAGLRLVAYDLRGHGRSTPVTDPLGHRLDAHVADLRRVAVVADADVVGGVSLGAHAAVAHAAERPTPRAVLACLPAWTGRAEPGEGPHAGVAAAVRTHGVAASIDGFPDDPLLPDWLRTVLVRDWSACDPESLLAALVALDGGLAPAEAELRALEVPLALVAWPDDPGHPLEVAEAWRDWAPRAALETLTLGDLDHDLEAFGRAAVRALSAVSRAW